MRRRALILATLATVWIGVRPGEVRSEEEEQEARANGASFSIPVPGGFSVVTEERFTAQVPGGVMLGADKPASPDLLIGSIVVSRIPPGPDFVPSDLAFCKEAAEVAPKQLPVELKGYRNVETALGQTCQWEVEDKETAYRGASSTVMYRTRDDSWVVTCNFDTRDTAMREACDEVLAGWEFE